MTLFQALLIEELGVSGWNITVWTAEVLTAWDGIKQLEIWSDGEIYLAEQSTPVTVEVAKGYVKNG